MKLNDSDYNKYLKIVSDIQSTQDESWRYVEKRLYAIASGTLALSITLLSTTINTTMIVHSKWLIIISWIFLTFSIIINLLSHIISHNSSSQTIKYIYGRMVKNAPFDSDKINAVINKHNRIITYSNLASIICLTFGIIGMVAFFIDQIIIY